MMNDHPLSLSPEHLLFRDRIILTHVKKVNVNDTSGDTNRTLR